jgi:hypothetical protein
MIENNYYYYYNVASIDGYDKIVELLIEANGDVNKRDLYCHVSLVF